MTLFVELQVLGQLKDLIIRLSIYSSLWYIDLCQVRDSGGQYAE